MWLELSQKIPSPMPPRVQIHVFNVHTGLDKHVYHALYLEDVQRFQIGTMTIPPKHIDFANDNLACIASAKHDVENGYEAEDGDGDGVLVENRGNL